MHIDLVKLIGEALHASQCGEKLSEPLDPHASVELHFESTPMIRVERTEDDAVVLSTQLSELPVPWSGDAAVAMLSLLSQPVPWSAGVGVSLVNVQDAPHLVASVSRRFLADGDQFSTAIDGFYDQVRLAVQVLRQ